MLENSDQQRVDNELLGAWHNIEQSRSATQEDLFMYTRHLWLSWCLRLGVNPASDEISLTGINEEFTLSYLRRRKRRAICVEYSDGEQNTLYAAHQFTSLKHRRYKTYINDKNRVGHLGSEERFLLALKLHQADLYSLGLFYDCQIESAIVQEEERHKNAVAAIYDGRGFDFRPYLEKQYNC